MSNRITTIALLALALLAPACDQDTTDSERADRLVLDACDIYSLQTQAPLYCVEWLRQTPAPSYDDYVCGDDATGTLYPDQDDCGQLLWCHDGRLMAGGTVTCYL